MDIKGNKSLQLKKTIYGLVQSAREFYKRLICELRDLGFSQNKSDLCLLSKGNQSNILILGIYVNDCLVYKKWIELTYHTREPRIISHSYNRTTTRNGKWYISVSMTGVRCNLGYNS
jgi:Reverse transcriptase (RNA-dependent DNA polymerase)